MFAAIAGKEQQDECSIFGVLPRYCHHQRIRFGGATRNVEKYEFSTTDEDGNVVRDKMSREETIRTMNELSAAADEGVIVEISGDGLAALVESKNNNLDEIMQRDPAEQAAFDADVIQLENSLRIVIPNLETNEQLYGSLEGADESAIRATTGIIKNYLMPSDVSGMSEEDRKSMIALGLEEAKYIAANYLTDEQSEQYLSAMETIAKYGMNGTVDENGKVTYNVQSGPVKDTTDVIKRKAPELYKEYSELMTDIVNHKSGEKYSAKFLDIMQRMAKVENSVSEGGTKTNRESTIEEYENWKEETENTALPTTFKGINYTDFQSFLESLRGQSSLSKSWMSENVDRFMKWLTTDYPSVQTE